MGTSVGHAVVTGLSTGVSYQFKVEAENNFGFSSFSQTLALTCAHVPAQPVAPVTTNDAD